MTAAWRLQLLPASFRNVAFFVPSAETSGGRRSVLHTFPGRETGYAEDLGKIPRGFSIEGYVVGTDYFPARNALINALEAPGSGKLIHPYYGEIDVQAGGYTVREMQDEGGMARFTMSFDDAGSIPYPSAAADTTSAVFARKSDTLSGSKSFFSSVYDIASKPYALTQSALGAADAVFSLIGDARKIVGRIAAFERDLDNIRGKGIQGILDVEGLANDIENVLTYGTSRDDAVAGGDQDAQKQMAELIEFVQTIPDRAPVAISSDDPGSLIVALSQQIGIAAAAGMLSYVPFSSAQEARETGGKLLDVLDVLSDETSSDDVFSALANLRAAIVADLDRRALSLPDLVTFTPPGATNSLALSWRLYGNSNGESDLIARNKIQNPGFISSGVPLEVLTDAD